MKKYEHLGVRWKSYTKQSIFYCCLFLWLWLIPVKGYSQNVRLTLKMNSVTLLQVFDELTRQTGYEFVYSSTILEKVGKVSVNVSNESLEKMCIRDSKDTAKVFYGFGRTFSMNLKVTF